VKTVDEAEIRLPSGEIRNLTGLAANQVVAVKR
jgi:hypothetical protein